jgi:hypothetical protein
MAGQPYEFKKDKSLHTFIINIIIFIIIMLIYKFGQIKNPDHMPICLIGSYILLNAGTTFVHDKIM